MLFTVGNIVFNQVRETNDHGPLNSWDRAPYVTLRGATPGKVKQMGLIFVLL
jgi:hypothetical protein